MNITATKYNIDFDVIKTLNTVESDSDLTSVFRDEIKTDYEILRNMARDKTLPKNIVGILKELFEKIILERKNFREYYMGISDSAPPEVPQLPRRYGKNKVLEDIKKAGGKKTELQRAMLAINDLKNMYVNLSNKCIKAYIGGEDCLNDTDFKAIVATSELVHKKLNPILKKK